MTRDQIKAELRRSACEDKDPFFECANKAFHAFMEWKVLGYDSIPWSVTNDRMIMLLVAEALE